MRRRAYALAFCPFAVLFLTQSSHAETLEGVRSLEIDMRGTITQQCALGAIPNLNLGDLTTTASSHGSSVALNCNVPIEVRVRATNGGIQNRDYPHGQGPYAGLLPYQLSFVMPVRLPEQSVVQASFRSSDLVAGRSFTSNGGIAVDGLQLRVDLGRPAAPAGLLGGDYGEIVEITITPI